MVHSPGSLHTVLIAVKTTPLTVLFSWDEHSRRFLFSAGMDLVTRIFMKICVCGVETVMDADGLCLVSVTGQVFSRDGDSSHMERLESLMI